MYNFNLATFENIGYSVVATGMVECNRSLKNIIQEYKQRENTDIPYVFLRMLGGFV